MSHVKKEGVKTTGNVKLGTLLSKVGKKQTVVNIPVKKTKKKRQWFIYTDPEVPYNNPEVNSSD